MKIRIKVGPLKINIEKTLSKKLKISSTESLEKIKKEISENATDVCTTADIWTSKVRRLLGVTVHWVIR